MPVLLRSRWKEGRKCPDKSEMAVIDKIPY